MAIQRNVACALLIKVDTGSSNALESLGYTVNGANIQERTYNEPVHSDELGGTSGPPVDIVHHGQVDIITLELTSYDPAVAAKLRLFRGIAEGLNPGFPCGLMFADSGSHRVLLKGENYTRNYLRCVLVDSNTAQIGSHASMLRLTFEAYAKPIGTSPVVWTMWNDTTT